MKSLYIIHTSFFFFQAEDGIRDSSVTGVQTCALPIYTMIRIIVSIYIPAGWRHLDDRIPSLNQIVPVFLQIIRLRISSRHPDNCNLVVERRLMASYHPTAAGLSFRTEVRAGPRQWANHKPCRTVLLTTG